MSRHIDADALLRWLQDQEDEILEAGTGTPEERGNAAALREVRAKVEAMARPLGRKCTFRAGVIASTAAQVPFLAVSTLIREAMLAKPEGDA